MLRDLRQSERAQDIAGYVKQPGYRAHRNPMVISQGRRQHAGLTAQRVLLSDEYGEPIPEEHLADDSTFRSVQIAGHNGDVELSLLKTIKQPCGVFAINLETVTGCRIYQLGKEVAHDGGGDNRADSDP